MLWKCCTQYANNWKAQQWPQEWKGSRFTPIPKKGDAKEYSKYGTIVLRLRVSKVMLKILQGRLEQYLNWELPDAEAEFRKSRRTRNQIANIHWMIEKTRKFQKNIYFCFIDYAKAFMWITKNCGKILKRWEYQTTLPASWETCMQVRKHQNLTCNNGLTQNWERSMSRLYIVFMLI